MPFDKTHRILFLACLLLSSSAIGQTFPHYFSISFSNNGQIENIVDEYYFNSADFYSPNDDVIYYKQNEFKWSLAYQYLNKKSILLGLQYSFHRRTDEYIPMSLPNGANGNGTKSQAIHSIAVSALYQYTFDRFSLSIGPSIPLMFFDEYSENLVYSDTNKITEENYSLDVGIAYGLNLKTTLFYFPTKHIFLNTTIEFGYLHAELGDVVEYSVHETTSTTSQNTLLGTYNSPFTKNFMTPPEFYFGIGYCF